MNQNKVFLVISLLLLAVLSACTKYQSPTGDVTNVPGVVPFKSGDEFEVKINSLDELGNGIADIGGFKVIVPSTKVDDFVKIRIANIIKDVGYAELLSAPEDQSENNSENIIEIPAENQTETSEQPAETPVIENVTGNQPEQKADVTAFEGDLIDLKPNVNDPDGDKIMLGFTSPFDSSGTWQTKVGDAGFYSVIITATDNKGSFVTKQMKVSVLSRNKLPVISMPDELDFNEGDFITLNPAVSDPDGDKVTITYSGWMAANTYQTVFGDAGKYTVTVTADDGVTKVTKDVQIVIAKVNRKPELTVINGPRIVVTEGDLIELKADATDPDGDKVTISFSSPLDADGKWQTKAGDVGSYEVNVSATDGTNVVTQEILIEVQRKNAAPVINLVTVVPPSVELKKPGDSATIKITVDATDPDGDSLTYTYSGYMDSAEKTVAYGEKGGSKTVTVTVSDGTESVSKDVSFDMNNWPCFDCQA